MDYPRDNVFTFMFSTYRRTAGIAFTAILIAAIPVTIALISNQQDVRQRASESVTPQTAITPFPSTNRDYKMYPSVQELSVPLSSAAQTGTQFSVNITRDGRTVSDYDDYRFRWTLNPTGVATIYCGSNRCDTRRIIVRPTKAGTTTLTVEATRDGRSVAKGQVAVRVGDIITTQTEAGATVTPTLIPTPTSAPLVLEERLFDFNDDGKVDELDLNILYVGFSKRTGD